MTDEKLNELEDLVHKDQCLAGSHAKALISELRLARTRIIGLRRSLRQVLVHVDCKKDDVATEALAADETLKKD